MWDIIFISLLPLSVSLTFIAFSRNRRTHANFVCSRDKSRFFGLQFGHPYKSFQGFLDSFLCPLNTKMTLGHFRSVQHCEVLFVWTGYHSDCIWQKRECSPGADVTEIFWRQAKKNIAKHVYMRRLVFSIVHNSGLWVACLVRMRVEVLLLHNWDWQQLFILFTDMTLNRLGIEMN